MGSVKIWYYEKKIPHQNNKTQNNTKQTNMTSMRHLARADKIVDWALQTKRNPTDTAGMEEDDEQWLLTHMDMEDYIIYEYGRRLELKCEDVKWVCIGCGK